MMHHIVRQLGQNGLRGHGRERGGCSYIEGRYRDYRIGPVRVGWTIEQSPTEGEKYRLHNHSPYLFDVALQCGAYGGSCFPICWLIC